MTKIPATADSRRIPIPRRSPDDLDDTEVLTRMVGAIMADRLNRFAGDLGADVVRGMMLTSLQAQVAAAGEKAWARWTVRAGR